MYNVVLSFIKYELCITNLWVTPKEAASTWQKRIYFMEIPQKFLALKANVRHWSYLQPKLSRNGIPIASCSEVPTINHQPKIWDEYAEYYH